MRDQYFVIVLMLTLLIGCQEKTEVADVTDSPTESGQSEQVEQTNGAESLTSAALIPAESVQEGADPKDVCKRLLTLLKNEDAAEAQKLFTRKAIAMMLRFDLPLTFPGQANATFEVSPASFATSKQELCQVMCTISETVDGSSVDAELGWMLKQSSEGWRISGMLLPLEKDKPMDFLNFESSADIGRVKSMLTGGPDVSGLQATNANND